MTDDFHVCVYCGEEVELDEIGIYCPKCNSYISRFRVINCGWDYDPSGDGIIYYSN